jgi:hypothetical protein
MMIIFTFVLIVVLISMAGLAAGVLLGRAPLQGTCNSATCSKKFACAGCKKRRPKEDPA